MNYRLCCAKPTKNDGSLEYGKNMIKNLVEFTLVSEAIFPGYLSYKSDYVLLGRIIKVSGIYDSRQGGYRQIHLTA